MAWDVRQTYYYLVCFATLLMMIIGVVGAIRNGLDMVLPEEPHRPSPIDMYERTRRPVDEEAVSLYTKEELEQMADEEEERMRRQASRRALRNLIGNIALVGVSAPVYVYHWRRVRNQE